MGLIGYSDAPASNRSDAMSSFNYFVHGSRVPFGDIRLDEPIIG